MPIPAEYLVPAVFMAVCALALLVTVPFARRGWRKELDRARSLATVLGLDYCEGKEAVRRAYADAGNTELAAHLERIPRLLLAFYSMGAVWRLDGRIGGIRVAVYGESRSSGDVSGTFTVVKAWYPRSLGFIFHASRQTFLRRLGKTILDLHGIATADGEFDAEVAIRTDDPLKTENLLGSAEAREALLLAVRACEGFRATGEDAQWERRGTTLDAAAIGTALGLVTRVARAIGS